MDNPKTPKNLYYIDLTLLQRRRELNRKKRIQAALKQSKATRLRLVKPLGHAKVIPIKTTKTIRTDKGYGNW